MKTKKILLGLGFALLGSFAQAQNGLESVIVEKYYVSNAADAAGSVGLLPTGSVTYRIYADMLPGYKFQVLYGVPAHELKINTSTTFFNNEDYGSTQPNGISVTNTRKNSVMLDSWFSVGGNAAGKVGILKNDDTDGALVNSSVPQILQNADPSAGVAISIKDGMIAGTPEAVTFVGFTTELDVFDATSQAGSSFSTTNGSIASLNGTTGPTADNRVLIGQFTTTGVFQFELNIQIGTPSGGVQNFVANNPVGAEISIPSLTRVPNTPPTVSITAPANGANIITGDVVAITASASDVSGIASVEFFDGVTSLGVDNTAPYSINWTSAAGVHNFTARATDADVADPLSTTSSIVSVTVANNQAPSVSVSAAASAVVGDAVSITSTTGDVDGTVSQVEFFVDNVSIGVDNSAPFTANWTAVLGNHNIKGTATDDRGATTTSSIVAISVVNNIPPTAGITSPLASATYTAPQVVTIDATATDPDGSVTQVEFFVNNVSVGVDASSPYSFNWTSVIGVASLTVKSTDDRGAVTTSAAVVLSIADPNALPYAVVTTTQTCLPSTVCIPVKAVDAVDNVIGYDVVMNYDNTMVTPTGNVTMDNDLINPTYVEVASSVDNANGKMYISAYFNSNAPGNAEFNGTGNIFCVEFTKTVNFTSVDTSVISVSSLEESYFTGVTPKLVQSGKYITYKDSLFTASLKFWADNSPIVYNSANPNEYLITNIYGNDAACATQSAVAVQPNLSGDFTYNIWNGVDVEIQRDILGTTDVQRAVNGFDAFLARKLLINDPSFVPTVYQIIALDVNTDGVVSAGDVSQINQRAVLIIPEFKQAWNYSPQGVSDGRLSKDWLFVDAARIATNPAYAISATFPANDGVGFSKGRVPVVPFCLPVTVTNYAVCPFITSETYTGVLIGDINGNYITVVPDGLLRNNTGKVVFDLMHAVVNGNTIDVPVFVQSESVVNALDFSMQFNDVNLAYNTVVNHASYIQALENLNADDNTLRFTSNSLENYDITQPIVSVRFDMTNNQVSADDLRSVVGYVNGEEVAVEVLGSFSTGIAAINTDNLASVYPNPSTGILNVVVTENATVELMDVSGKLVFVKANVNANEKQEINVSAIANGVYMMRIYNSNFSSTKKVVINK